MPASTNPSPVVESQGARIPQIGLGTWDLRGKTCVAMVADAIARGYRHIDTAAMYENEAQVGEGLRASGLPRDEVFVTTKVWPSNLATKDFARSARDSLKKLKLDAVDLLLIHWPNPSIPLKETIAALCQAKRDGLARHIGVSNFTSSLIAEATSLATEPLAVNQFECHPLLDQTKLIAATKKAGLAVTAYSPIAKGAAPSNAVLARIGKPHGKSAAQISLRWLMQQDIVAIPRTSKPERLSENIAVFDFVLTDAEMAEIGKLSHEGRRMVDGSMAPKWD